MYGGRLDPVPVVPLTVCVCEAVALVSVAETVSAAAVKLGPPVEVLYVCVCVSAPPVAPYEDDPLANFESRAENLVHPELGVLSKIPIKPLAISSLFFEQ